jgi:hypothetical protein
MPSFRISETEILDAKRIKSFTTTEREAPEVAEEDEWLGDSTIKAE